MKRSISVTKLEIMFLCVECVRPNTDWYSKVYKCEWVSVCAYIFWNRIEKKKNKLKRYIYTSLISILCSYRICNRLTTQLSLRWSHIIRDHKYIHINTHTHRQKYIYTYTNSLIEAVSHNSAYMQCVLKVIKANWNAVIC